MLFFVGEYGVGMDSLILGSYLAITIFASSELFLGLVLIVADITGAKESFVMNLSLKSFCQTHF